jgi:hypothetical protein
MACNRDVLLYLYYIYIIYVYVCVMILLLFEKVYASTCMIYLRFKFHMRNSNDCRSECPRDLRHEPSSPAQTLGSWVRISLDA